jgi:hypothetical protein
MGFNEFPPASGFLDPSDHNFLRLSRKRSFFFLADLTQTIENVYEICTNIVPTITQALKSLPNQIVEGVKKAHGSWF